MEFITNKITFELKNIVEKPRRRMTNTFVRNYFIFKILFSAPVLHVSGICISKAGGFSNLAQTSKWLKLRVHLMNFRNQERVLISTLIFYSWLVTSVFSIPSKSYFRMTWSNDWFVMLSIKTMS